MTANPFAALVSSQQITTIPQFVLESGVTLNHVPVAFKTWGTLNSTRDNVMIICHALTGSADVEDWWGPLLGKNKAFDPSRYFIFCANVIGSPYGTISPVTIDPATGNRWASNFPQISIRDDIRLHRLVLDFLNVASVAVVIGGSMGGMACLEWPLCFPGYVRHVIPIATCARHSAWGISWGEAQRQSIYSDPNFLDGHYDFDNPPASGLGAARMAAMLTYRSRDSFESRFGRKEQPSPKHTPRQASYSGKPVTETSPNPALLKKALNGIESSPPKLTAKEPIPQIYSAQAYLRYQGAKFISRFDANCYITITKKMDTHDLWRERGIPSTLEDGTDPVLSQLPAGALIIAIRSDGLFTLGEHYEMQQGMRDAELVIIESPDGHDGFLLEFEQINKYILAHLQKRLPDIYAAEPLSNGDIEHNDFEIKKNSVFGEAEADVALW